VSLAVLGLLALQFVNVVLFATLTARASHVMSTTGSRPLRQISVAYVVLCPVMLIRILLSAADLILVEVEAGQRLVVVGWLWWLALVEVATAVAGVLGLRSVGGAYREIEHGEQVVSALTNRVPSEANLRRAGLTDREWEVADLLGEGVLSDEEIAARLHIAPSTAGTHVRNILRKSGLNDRRQLMVLRLREPRAQPPE
jgi:DNA-binding CsgD family transcriptional regulator